MKNLSAFTLSIFTAAMLFVGPTHGGWFGDYFTLENNRCYGRTYSKAHLAKHPRQLVKKMSIGHFPLADKNTGEGFSGPNTKKSGIIFLHVKVWFRDKAGPFTQIALCKRDGGVLKCPIECDGGRFQVQARGKKLLLKTKSFLVVKVDGCGGDVEGQDYRAVGKNSDDNAFLLSQLPKSKCIAPKRP